MKAMPLPFEEEHIGKGVLDFGSSLVVSDSLLFQQQQHQFLQRWRENCCYAGIEPNSVDVFDLRKPNPQPQATPTSSSTLSSSHGSAAGGASADSNNNKNHIPEVEGKRCGMEDWESVLSESPSQDQDHSILKLIMEDIEDASMGLSKLLQVGTSNSHSHSHSQQDVEFNGFSFMEQQSSVLDPISSNVNNNNNNFVTSIDSSSVVAATATEICSDFPFGRVMNQIQNPIFNSSLSHSGLFHPQQQPIESLDSKLPQFVMNQSQTQFMPNPSLAFPFSYSQLQENQEIHPQPPAKRLNCGNNYEFPKIPFMDSGQEMFLRRQQHLQQQQLQLLPHHLQQRPVAPKQKMGNPGSGGGEDAAGNSQFQQAIIDQLFKAAELIEAGNPELAHGILARLNHQISPIGKPFQRAAFYFKEALQLLLQSNVNSNNNSFSPTGLLLKIGAYKSFSEISTGIATQGAASSADALEMVSSLGKALIDFGRGVVDDIGRAGAPSAYRNHVTGIGQTRDLQLMSFAAELKGLPCPTATGHLKKLGVTELWIGNKEQQSLMVPLGEKFVHPKLLDRQLLRDIFSNTSLQALLKLQNFSLNLLAHHMKLIFHEDWVNHVMGSNTAPWLSWEKLPGSGSQGGPSTDWVRIFWKSFKGSQEELSLFSDWPLIPAFLGRPVLCRVRERHLVFIPPPLEHTTSTSRIIERESTDVSRDNNSQSDLAESYVSAFERLQTSYPWLLPMLNQCNIPIFDEAFLDCAASSNCFPIPGRSLGLAIASKLVAVKQAGYFTEPTNFSASNCDALFSLFSDEFFSNGIRYSQEEIEVLRSLPIYKTVVGSHTKLQGQDQCMIPSNSFFKPYDEHCLSYATDSNESSFVRALGVLELHDQQILVRFGLPHFERKLQNMQEEILVYVFKNWHDLQSDQSVVEALKETKFVRSSDEFSTDLLKPMELFDPGDALLISIFFGERKKFPGERFSTEGWIRILRKLGLRTASDVDVIMECAKRVEFLGIECMKSGDLDDFGTDTTNSRPEVSPEVWALGGSVVEFVFSNFALFFSHNFCDLLGKIACVPAELGFPSVGCKRVLASYSEAILYKDWPLAWSCAPILCRQYVMPPEYSWGALHLRSPPAFSTVLKHLQVIGKNGGEDTLAHWPIVSGLDIEKCTCEILKYLDKIWGSLSPSDVAELRGVAFLPAANGTRLVTPDALFARLMINLSPFAFELPAVYLPFAKILKDLGLQDMLTLSAAKDLLLNLQKACGYQHLNPNELRAVMEILNFICDQIGEGNPFDGYDWKSEVIVPDDGCRLVHSTSCVYVDPDGSRYVKCINTSRIRFVHADLPERVCIVLGIKKLSDVVIEELDENQILQTLGSVGSVSLVTIKQKLSSKSLQSAAWTVVNSMGSYIPALNRIPLEQIESILNSIAEKLQFVKYLKTRFLLLPNLVDVTCASKDFIIPEWNNESSHQTLYYMNQTRSCILIAEPPTYISLFDLISIIVSQVLGSPIILPIGSLFDCPEGFENAVVNVLKLCSDKKEVESVNGSSNMVGKDLLPQDARLVQFHPLRPFYSGEIVAWRSQHGEKLKYGRVSEDVRPPAGQAALYRFKIEVAPGVAESFLSSQVFSFKSVSASSPLKETSVHDSPILGSNSSRVDFPESSGRGELNSQVPSLREQSGKVSAAELVHAVNEILSAAGINMDAEKQALLQKTVDLQENLKESQAALLLEQEKVERSTKEADTAKAAWTCRVCLSYEVDITLVPCGHVLCRKCSSAVSKCPFCRLQVTRAIRIFRP